MHLQLVAIILQKEVKQKMSEKDFDRHCEVTVLVKSTPKAVFEYADVFRNFSAHMNQSQMMMAGSKMNVEADKGEGRQIGSHIRMGGTVMGIPVFLDEVIIERNPPFRKVWKTEKVNLLVIDQYRLGFEITPNDDNSKLLVFIDYDLPKTWKTKVLGWLFGDMYAKWCVGQMAIDTKKHFENLSQK